MRFDAMDLKLYDTLTREKRASSRSIRPTCACMSAGRRSTTTPISATRGRWSCSTCCSACCAIIYGASHVIYVRNITDVDDKINARAAEEYRACRSTRRSARSPRKPTAIPRGRGGARLPAADRRAARHRAYRRDDRADRAAGAPATPMWPKTMCCSACRRCRLRQALEALARRHDRRRPGRVAPYKRDPADFVLWKPSKPGEPVWEARRSRRAGPAGTSSARR